MAGQKLRRAALINEMKFKVFCKYTCLTLPWSQDPVSSKLWFSWIKEEDASCLNRCRTLKNVIFLVILYSKITVQVSRLHWLAWKTCSPEDSMCLSKMRLFSPHFNIISPNFSFSLQAAFSTRAAHVSCQLRSCGQAHAVYLHRPTGQGKVHRSVKVWDCNLGGWKVTSYF